MKNETLIERLSTKVSVLDQSDEIARELLGSIKTPMSCDMFIQDITKTMNAYGASEHFTERYTKVADFAAIEASKQANVFSELLQQALDCYRLPSAEGMAKQMVGDSSVVDYFREDISSLTQLIQSVDSPLLDSVNTMESLARYTGLLGIGHSIHKLPSFSDQLTEMLRYSLGDWQSTMTLDETAYMTSIERLDLYKAKGFDSRLSEFSDDTFHEGIIVAGLAEMPPIVSAYRDKHELDQGKEVKGLHRTNRAHAVIYSFETHVRQFIDKNMTLTYGEAWISTQVDYDTRRGWQEKQEHALDKGQEKLPLITYADFGDYLKIITQRKHWNEVFKVFFNRKESVIESFQRLYPIRHCTMHSRPVNQSDELYLHAETTRILTAIGCLQRD